ncbi:MAG: hypothetical protein RL557_807 [archaeon]|jgi:hypothetical protein
MKRGTFSFGSIFGKAIEDYKKNFKAIFLFMFVFIGIFSLLSFIISALWILNDETTRNFVVYALFADDLSAFPWTYFICMWALGIIGILLSIFVWSGFVSMSVRKETFRFGDLVRAGKSTFLNYLGLLIVSGIFLLGLFLLLIIPGIIFGVYWLLSSYVLLYEKKDILTSLKRSKEIIKGNWWRVFGYLILILIILVLVSVIVSVVVQPTQIVQMIHMLNTETVSLPFFMINSLLGVISQFITSLITVPFSILFFKNLYFALRK